MKRISPKFNLIILSLAILGGFAFASAALAGPPPPDLISVNFERSPLFDEANFLPGDVVMRGFTVTNVSSENLNVALKLDPYDDEDDLGSQIQAIIKEHDSISNIFSGTLDDLASAGLWTLNSNLAPGASVTYDFSATFNPTANNDYQSTDEDPVSLFFDIVIGVESESGQVQTFGSTSGSSSGGGFSSCGNGIVEGGEQCDNPSGNGPLPNFCSRSCTLNSGVAGTSTTQTGLSYEENGGVGEPPAQGLVNGGLATTRGSSADIGAGENGGKILGEATQAKDENAPVGVCSPHYWWWWIGYLVYALLLLLAFWVERKEKSWWMYIIGILLPVVAILWWWFEPCPKHWWVWPVGIIVYGIILYALFYPLKKNGEQPKLPLDNPPATPV